MRLLEVAIMLSLLIYHLGFVFKTNKPGWILVPGGILLMILFHLFLEGHR